MDVGIIGVGRMGRIFALHLADAGHQVIAVDPYVDPDAELIERGVRFVTDLAEALTAPVSMSMLPNAPEVVLAALTGPEGVLAAAPPGHTHVAMGTMGPATVAELARAAHERGVRLAEAPISGSVPGAIAKAITTMVGADDETFALVQPLLAAFTGAQFHVGVVGAGSIAKLAVNIVIGATNQAVSESLLLAEAAGLDRADFYEVLRASAAGGKYVEYKRAAFLDPEHPIEAVLSIPQKDLALALDAARELGLTLPGAQTSADTLDRAAAAGYGEQDMAHLIDFLRAQR